MWNPPAGGANVDPNQYPGAPAPESGAYPQQSYAPPVPDSPGYASQPYAGAQPYQQQFGPQQPFPGQYPPPGPPASGPNALWFVVGGVALLVVVALVVVIALAVGSDDSGSSNAGGGGDGAKAKYTANAITNTCDLIDPSVLAKWAPNQKKAPEHTERKSPGSLSSYDCRAENEGSTSDYRSASLWLDANITESKYSDPAELFKIREQSVKGTTGTGKSSGDVPGIGAKAVFASDQGSSRASYEITVIDGNLIFSVRLSAYGRTAPSLSDLEETAQAQARQVLQKVRR